jgi:ATP-dependent 26S proteasome regulatory subunit
MEKTKKNLYKASIEHIYDELLHIDLLLHAEVINFRSKNPANMQLDHLKGLYISDSEIDEILQGSSTGYDWVKKAPDETTEYGKLRLAAASLRKQIDERLKNSRELGITFKLSQLEKMFGCSPLEIAMIIVCMAPELDQKYRKLFSYLHNDTTRKHPSVDLVLNLVCNSYQEKVAARSSFSLQSPLFKNRLIEFIENEFDKNRPLLARDLRVNDRITGYLLDGELVDDTLAKVAGFYKTEYTFDDIILPAETKEYFKNFIEYYTQDEENRENYVLSFCGLYGSEKLDTAAILCQMCKIPLLTIDLEAIFHSDEPFETILDLALRESIMLPAALYFKNCDYIFDQEEETGYFLNRYFIEKLENNSSLTFIDSEKKLPLHGEFSIQTYLELEFPLPDYKKRMELWQYHIEKVAPAKEYDIDELSSKFALSSDQIKKAVTTGHNIALWRSPLKIEMQIDDIYESCQIHSSQRLGDLAHKIKPRYSWTDIVLPEENAQLLQDLTKNVRFKHMVYDNWGFNRKLSIGKGINALFWGSPGTGKTMCADIIAHELSMELYKIDLSTIVSKYIGETEKNLDRIFTEAERSNAILFFDEADALFGKRSEVKDSHDRYANIEVGYLLQRMEEYSGVVILSSNLKKNMDDAFTRRLQYVVHFPFPDEVSRLDIWKNIFPEEAPVEENLDYEFFAKEFKLAGGNIKNIALGAAFFAAEHNESISLDHILQASKREYQKIRRPLEFDDIVKKIEKVH